MVWFQCEDCGENLKKPKLSNHFRVCSAAKLSCIDCGQTFSQQSVQAHTQCISEAEKYGPKDQVKAANNAQSKSGKAKQHPDVDLNVGLSSHAPWHCSLCNTNTTSKQTLTLHAEGKKHRAKARAFHAAQKQSCQTAAPTSNEKDIVDDSKNAKPDQTNSSMKVNELKERDLLIDNANLVAVEKAESLTKKKRKHDATSRELANDISESKACDLSNGEVIQAEQTELSQCEAKKKKRMDGGQQGEEADKDICSSKASENKIKLKKLVVSALKANPDGVMKVKKLQKQVIRVLLESGASEDESQLRNMLMEKINSSSRFVIDNKCIRLVTKTGRS